MYHWPGGHCPDCGEYMPEHLVHCRTCRALLSDNLKQDSVELAQFSGPEEEQATMPEAELGGFHVECPNCQRELRIAQKYTNERVQCKFCKGQFRLDLTSPAIHLNGFYADCPHCERELRAAEKYLGTKAACKFCGGHMRFAHAYSPS